MQRQHKATNFTNSSKLTFQNKVEQTMSHERKGHHKTESKEQHRRHDKSDDDDAKQLSQQAQHILKDRRGHKGSKDETPGVEKYLPGLKLSGNEKVKPISAVTKPDDKKEEPPVKDIEKRLAAKGQCEVPAGEKTAETKDSTELTDQVKEEVPKTAESLSKKYGVKMTVNSEGKYECSINTSGKDVALGIFEKSPEGLDSVDKALSTRLNDKKSALEKEFKLKFETAATSPEYGNRAREPRLDELDALDSALRKSRASLSSSDNLRILFIDELREFEPSMQTQGVANRIVIFGPPRGAVTSVQRSDAQKQAGILDSVEDDFLHEFGHVAENTANAADYSKFGWRRLENNNWAKVTTDDKLYIWNERKNANCESPAGWVEVDGKGNFIHPNSLEGLITNSQMMEKALVKPSSDYFYTPRDDFAEGVARYRQSPESRAKLAREAPELSKYVEEFDKKELAEKLGVGEGNKPLYKRDEKFVIVRDESVAEKPLMTKVKDALIPYFIYIPQLPLYY